MKNVTTTSLFLIFLTFSGFSQGISNINFGAYPLDGKLMLYTDTTNKLTIEGLLQNRGKIKFEKIAGSSINYKINNKTNWVIFDVANTSSIPIKTYLKCSHPFTDFYTVYTIEEGKIVDSAHFDYERKVSKNFIRSARTPVFEHQLKAQTQTTFVLKINNEAGALVHTYDLYDEASIWKDNTYSQLIYFVFFGIGLTLFLISLAFLVISKEVIYLYYALYVVFVNLAFQGIVGILNNLFSPKIDYLLGDSAFRFYMSMGVIANVLFLNRLFDIGRRNKTYRIFSYFIIFLASTTVILSALDWGFIYYKINKFISPETLLVLTVVFTIIYNFKRKPEAFRLYLFSFLPIFVLILWKMLILWAGLPQPTFFAVYFIFALIFELLILLIGLSYHFIKRLYAQKHLEKQIITKQIETQEQERKKIAEDLHDDLGSTLALLKEQIGINQANATQIAEKAIKDLRQISHQLVPLDFHAFGFMPSLKKHVQNLKETDMDIEFISFGEPKKLASDIELNIYRIIVELLHNIKKHSQHKEVTLQLIYHQNLLHVAIERQNKEVEVPKSEFSKGLGERSVLARIDYINARIIEKGTPENGYSFSFEVPY